MIKTLSVLTFLLPTLWAQTTTSPRSITPSQIRVQSTSPKIWITDGNVIRQVNIAPSGAYDPVTNTLTISGTGTAIPPSPLPEEFTALAGQTSFPLIRFDPLFKPLVFVNGLLEKSNVWTLSGTTLVFLNTQEAGNSVTVVYVR